MRRHIEKRLTSLYSGELTAVITFAILSWIVNNTYPYLNLYSLSSFWAAFFLMEILLLQGTVYWYAKLKRLRNRMSSITLLKIVRKLIFFKKINLLLIVIPLFTFIYDLFRLQSPLPVGGLLISLFIYLFAILEYINYFYTQLSYDNMSDLKYLKQRKVLKPACMKRDMNRLVNKGIKEEPLK